MRGIATALWGEGLLSGRGHGWRSGGGSGRALVHHRCLGLLADRKVGKVGELQVQGEVPLGANVHVLSLKDGFSLFGGNNIVELHQGLGAAVSGLLRHHNNLEDPPIGVEDLVQEVRSYRYDRADVIMGIGHGNEEDGAFVCGFLLQFAVARILDVDAAASDLGVAAGIGIYEVDGSLQCFHLEEGLVLVAQHNNVFHTTEWCG